MYETPDNSTNSTEQNYVAQLFHPAEINIEVIETLVERLIRKQILKQYVKSDHPVLRMEEKLVGKSKEILKNEMLVLVAITGRSLQLIKIDTFARIKKVSSMMVRLFDIDEDMIEIVLPMLADELHDEVY